MSFMFYITCQDSSAWADAWQPAAQAFGAEHVIITGGVVERVLHST
jgi:hypothetical protein